jgi:glyoxylate/hydroxypyruvate reductase
VKALEENLIGSAGLDVTDPEPLSPTHKLYSFSNCLILPHIGNISYYEKKIFSNNKIGSATLETRERMANMSLDNVLAALNNQPLPFSV